MKYIKKFEEISIHDIPIVGGKNASLGEMIRTLSKKNIRVPRGFAVTAEAYWHYINHNNLLDRMKQIMNTLVDTHDLKHLQQVGEQVRTLLVEGSFPNDLKDEIIQAYHDLSSFYDEKNLDVAVRSSATAEDLPGASFAGQQETFLNVKGETELLESCKKSIASLFTNRAIIYRIEKGFDHFDVALSIGVQKMVRSDLASSGVIFTIDTETGFKDLVMINSSYGLGEAIVKGEVNPDEFRIFKPTLEEGFKPIIKKSLGSKEVKIVYAQGQEGTLTKTVSVPKEARDRFSLTNNEILELAKAGIIIEDHYSAQKGSYEPMDIEWAKDGVDKHLYILQARPETVHAIQKDTHIFKQYRFVDIDKQTLEKKLLLQGQSIGQQIASGKARIVKNINQIDRFEEGDILVTRMTDPDWVPIMKKASAIITDQGGRTCHAAIVSRELGISAIVGTIDATKTIKEGQEVTIDCSKGKTGFVYDGEIPFEVQELNLKTIPKLPIKLLVNIGNPDAAIPVSFLPVDGVGLARIEFIISNVIKIHPLVLLEPEEVEDKKIENEIDKLTAAYPDKKTFFVQSLAQGIGTIAAAFYRRPVLVRLSDFKSNEYRNLIGGKYFEPEEENPMLGLRGASRYYSDLYKKAFALECEAIIYARDVMGLKNINVMIPFVRTIDEAKEVIQLMKDYGLDAQQDDFMLYMMVEVPSNVLLIKEFANYFDGFSIGSNDLTQMVLAVDRDSGLLAPLFDERNEAVKQMIKMAIDGAHEKNKPIGICGQAPSDYPEVADFLIKAGIDSLSLNADSVLPFLMRYK